MKKTLALFLCAVLMLSLLPAAALSAVAEEGAKIEVPERPTLTSEKVIYQGFNNGNDANDGLTKATAKKTYGKLASESGIGIVSLLDEGGKVVMIAALEGNQANTDRQRGFEKAIEEHGLEVVATGNHDWDTTLSQQTMAEILNSGVEFDGVLVSQCAENAFEAFDAAGVPYPKFIGFGDTGAYMQKMLDVNKDEVVTKYIVLSNPPGVGATAFNFALNLYEGKELKDGVFAEGFEDTHQIWIQSKVCYTDEDVTNGTQIDGKSIEEYANSYEAGDSITFWLTKQEVADTYFN